MAHALARGAPALWPPTAAWGIGGLIVIAAALALLPLPYNVAAVVGLATVGLVLARPTWGLYLVMLSVPIQDVAAVRLGGTAITATKVIVPVALVAWLTLRLTQRLRQPGAASQTRSIWRISWLTLPYGLYVAVLAASTIGAVNQMTALIETTRWAQAFGVFVMTLDLIRTRKDLIGLVAVLLLGGIFQAGVGLAQSVLGAGPASFAVAAGFSRAFGTFGMPNSYAGYLEMSLPLALAVGVWLSGRLLRRGAGQTPRWHRVAWLFAAVATSLLVLGIYASYSRGAWLGTLVGIGVMIALAGRRSLIGGLVTLLIVASLLGIGGAALLPAGISERLTTITESLAYRDVRRMVITPENWAVAERLAMWEAGLTMFRAQPISGVGAGNFDGAYARYRVPQFIYSRGHAHNYYIHVAAETGILGLAAYTLVVIAAWLDLGRALRRLQGGWLRAVAIGAGGVLAAVMTHHLVENLHVLNMNIHLFAVLALPALALSVQTSERGAGAVEAVVTP